MTEQHDSPILYTNSKATCCWLLLVGLAVGFSWCLRDRAGTFDDNLLAWRDGQPSSTTALPDSRNKDRMVRVGFPTSAEPQDLDGEKPQLAEHLIVFTAQEEKANPQDNKLVLRAYDLHEFVPPRYEAQFSTGQAGKMRPLFGEHPDSNLALGNLGGAGNLGALGALGGDGVLGGGLGGGPVPDDLTPGANHKYHSRPTMAEFLEFVRTVIGEQDEGLELGGLGFCQDEELAQPGSWRLLGTTLMLRATAKKHQLLQETLNVLREHWGTQKGISVRLTALAMTPQQVDALQPQQGKKHQLDPAAWKKFVAKVAKEPSTQVAVSKCLNGQSIALVNLQQTPEEPATPKTPEQPTSNPNPQLCGTGVSWFPINIEEPTLFGAGIAFECTPYVPARAKHGIVNLRLLLSRPPTAPAKGGEAKLTPHQEQRITTTMKVPVGSPYLVGTLTTPTEGDASKQVYLVLELDVEETQP